MKTITLQLTEEQVIALEKAGLYECRDPGDVLFAQVHKGALRFGRLPPTKAAKILKYADGDIPMVRDSDFYLSKELR